MTIKRLVQFGHRASPKTIAAYTDAIVRIMTQPVDGKTVRHALDILRDGVKMGPIKDNTFNDLHIDQSERPEPQPFVVSAMDLGIDPLNPTDEPMEIMPGGLKVTVGRFKHVDPEKDVVYDPDGTMPPKMPPVDAEHFFGELAAVMGAEPKPVSTRELLPCEEDELRASLDRAFEENQTYGGCAPTSARTAED